MSPWRITVILCCFVPTAALWLWAAGRDGVAAGLPLPLVIAFGVCAAGAVLLSQEAPGRRRLAVVLALVCGVLWGWQPLTLLRDHAFALALVCTVVAWTAGLAAFRRPRRGAVPAAEVFPLERHLDSPQAQEGADKYTRE